MVETASATTTRRKSSPIRSCLYQLFRAMVRPSSPTCGSNHLYQLLLKMDHISTKQYLHTLEVEV